MRVSYFNIGTRFLYILFAFNSLYIGYLTMRIPFIHNVLKFRTKFTMCLELM